MNIYLQGGPEDGRKLPTPGLLDRFEIPVSAGNPIYSPDFTAIYTRTEERRKYHNSPVVYTFAGIKK